MRDCIPTPPEITRQSKKFKEILERMEWVTNNLEIEITSAIILIRAGHPKMHLICLGTTYKLNEWDVVTSSATYLVTMARKARSIIIRIQHWTQEYCYASLFLASYVNENICGVARIRLMVPTVFS